MRAFFLVVSLLMFGANMTLAATVKIRSGEHETFTRMVFYFPKVVQWSVETNDSTAILKLEAKNITFDTSLAFEKIGRNRLLDLVPGQEAGSIQLNMACNCAVTASEHGPTIIVVDLSDPLPIDVMADTPAAMPASDPPERQGVTLPLMFPYSTALTAPALREADAPSTADSVENMARKGRVETAEMILKQQIAHVSDQGLLDVENPSARAKPPANESEQAKPGTKEPQPQSPQPQMNLRAESVIDRDLQKVLGTLTRSIDAQTCLTSRDLPFAEPDKESGFAKQVAEARFDLFGEFDRIDPVAVTELASVYIYYGFGAEASEVLNMASTRSSEMERLAALAAILENGSDPEQRLFDGQSGCDTAGAVWAVLSNPEIAPRDEINTNAILREFTALPQHLREFLGPRLSERLLQAGRKDAAKSLLRILNRASESPSPQTEMVSAKLAIEQGHLQDATISLNAVVSANNESSPEALVALIDANLAQDVPISPETAELAGAFALELRDQPIGDELDRAYVLALSDAGRFAKAIEHLVPSSAQMARKDYEKLATKVLGIITRKADDLAFLSLLSSQEVLLPREVYADVANRIADRLLRLGFAQLAGPYLSAPAQGDAIQTQHLLRAKLALMERQPRRALVELASLQSSDASVLRAQAHQMTGDFSQATKVFTALDERDQATHAALLAENWLYLANSGDPNLANIGQLMQSQSTSENAQPEAGSGSLAQGRQLLAQSEATRRALSELLASQNKPNG